MQKRNSMKQKWQHWWEWEHPWKASFWRVQKLLMTENHQWYPKHTECVTYAKFYQWKKKHLHWRKQLPMTAIYPFTECAMYCHHNQQKKWALITKLEGQQEHPWTAYTMYKQTCLHRKILIKQCDMRGLHRNQLSFASKIKLRTNKKQSNHKQSKKYQLIFWWELLELCNPDCLV